MRQHLPPGDFFVLTSRAERRPKGDDYGWSVRQALPRIPISLLAPDPDVILDLQAVCATGYERGRYARALDYKAPLDLPLSQADRAWAEEPAQTPRG